MFVRNACLTVSCLLIAGCAAPLPPDPASPPPRAVVSTPPVMIEVPPVPEPEPIPIEHAGIGASVQVSSTSLDEPGEGPPEALVDGDLSTRWSSAYDAPQQVSVTLPEPRRLAALRLHWEAASAQDYTVSVSADGDAWSEVASIVTDDPGPRVDAVDLEGRAVLALRLDLRERINPEWGFSLFQIELVAGE